METAKIKEQIEFYFSNSNYAKDKFLQETAIKNNKCIPISIILTFQRMKALDATLDAVKEAAKDSELVEVVEDSLRKVESKEYLEYRADKDIAKRVVHMKGFSTELALDDLKALLAEHCSPVKILMRRDRDRSFRGSCFVEFASAAEAEAALALKIEAAPAEKNEDEAKRAKQEPAYVEIISKEAYIAEKKSETKDDTKDDKFIEKIKADFIPKLFRYESEAALTIQDLKELVRNVAFVDVAKKIVRMKYREDWDEKEFEKEDKKVKIVKMGEEEAREYVGQLNIKKAPKKK